ncbi:MAG: cell division protein FtsA [Terriglobales bacterium]
MKAAPVSTFNILDLGTARTTLLQVRVEEAGMAYAGHVTVATEGMRKGAVVNLQAVASGIRSAAMGLERRTGTPVERVFVSLTGAQVRGLTSQAGMTLSSRSHEVMREDARRVLDLARNVTLPDDRQILHVIPQEFVLDRQGGIHEPVGMLATRLETRIYAITAALGAKDNLVLAVNHGGLEVEELIFAPLADAEACLAAEDRYEGVAVVDAGAGTTTLLAYTQGSLSHAAAIPIGGDHFTNDIAIGLSTPHADAERIKCGYGLATAANAGETSAIEVPSAGDLPARLLPLRKLCDCIEPRARELVRLLGAELAKAGGLGAGIVLCGGAGRLNGLPDMLAASTSLLVRMGKPTLIAGMPDELAEPEFAFAVGACYYAHRLLSREQHAPTFWEKLRARWAALADQ